MLAQVPPAATAATSHPSKATAIGVAAESPALTAPTPTKPIPAAATIAKQGPACRRSTKPAAATAAAAAFIGLHVPRVATIS